MLITDQIEVPQPLDAVWTFFGDIPQVAACLPGANLTDEVRDWLLERAGRGVRSPLHGIPFLVKDNMDVAGMATTAGSRSTASPPV